MNPRTPVEALRWAAWMAYGEAVDSLDETPAWAKAERRLAGLLLAEAERLEREEGESWRDDPGLLVNILADS